MKKIILAFLVAFGMLSISGCGPATEAGALVGGAGGALYGYKTSKDHKVRNAAVGAAAGAVAGGAVGAIIDGDL